MAINVTKGNKIVDMYLADAKNCTLALYTDKNTEVTGGGYARVPVEFCKANEGQAFNINAVEFPIATASWGTVKYACVMNGDELIYQNQLTTPQTINTGNKFIVPEHRFIVRIKGLI